MQLDETFTYSIPTSLYQATRPKQNVQDFVRFPEIDFITITL